MPSLDVINNVTLSVNKPNSGVVVYAKQFDKIARVVNISLISGSGVWDPPSDTAIVVMYSKPDGKKGIYDVADSVEIYSNEKTYPAGSEVRHGDSIYTNPNAINTPENWTAAHWTYVKAVTPAVTKTGTGAYRLILAEQALTVAGNVMVEISFFSGSKRATTLSFIVNVEPGVSDNTVLSGDYFNVLSGLIEGLLGAAVNPPIIDDTTKNWLLWSQEQGTYVDSGYSSIGLTGLIGPRGYSITALTLVSGDHTAGTNDTYRVDLDNGESAGTFNVWNGANAAGSADPGNLNPNPDGEASPGVDNAYARRDHVHPLNVDNVDPEDIGETASPGTSNAYARRDHRHSVGQSLFDAIYPIGSIYMSVNSTDPSTLFGGTWVTITNRFLIGAGDTYNSEETGGSANHTITIAEMPAHSHTVYYNNNVSGSGNNRRNIAGQSGDSSIANGVGSTGGGTAFSILPPYFAVYMWRRTA